MSNYIDLSKCIAYLRPDEHWALSDNDYERLEWFSDTTPPTLQELQNVWDKVTAQVQAEAEAKAQAKAAAEGKLAALGLTADDLKALGL